MATDEYNKFKIAYPKDDNTVLVTSDCDIIVYSPDEVSLNAGEPLKYSQSHVEMVLNHILSKQKDYQHSNGSRVYVSDFINEANVLGFNVLSEGKDIHGK